MSLAIFTASAAVLITPTCPGTVLTPAAFASFLINFVTHGGNRVGWWADKGISFVQGRWQMRPVLTKTHIPMHCSALFAGRQQ